MECQELDAHSNDDLLQILHAHGQQFLSSFSLPAPSSGQKRKLDEDSDDSEEWAGIQTEEYGSDGDTENDFEHEDDEFTSSIHTNNVVVFSETATRSGPANVSQMAQKKAFMICSVIQGVEAQARSGSSATRTVRTNAQNDALLHRLVHTKLLSGSLNPELDLTPAHRRKALAGRVLELTGQAKLGKGERSVRESERNKAAKRVREGMVDKQKHRQKQQLEEAKNLGNYHPTIKKLFESSSTTSMAPNRKRDRGLKMGVGKFSGGMLKLSRDEISRVQDEPRRGGGRGRGGRGGGSSRGRRT
ncbi:hypothetical protein B0H10DRAFT_2045736 [Mycena sp. CBHHK59/15]|nr:hypothetical protein B0H10DRAFT_2045736 [Mycena sp. CBHHK59/15]